MGRRGGAQPPRPGGLSPAPGHRGAPAPPSAGDQGREGRGKAMPVDPHAPRAVSRQAPRAYVHDHRQASGAGLERMSRWTPWRWGWPPCAGPRPSGGDRWPRTCATHPSPTSPTGWTDEPDLLTTERIRGKRLDRGGGPGGAHRGEAAIGAHVAGLVEDGATLQLGIGAIPNAVLAALRGHRDLGVHTEMFSDGVVDLVRGRGDHRGPQAGPPGQGGGLLRRRHRAARTPSCTTTPGWSCTPATTPTTPP